MLCLKSHLEIIKIMLSIWKVKENKFWSWFLTLERNRDMKLLLVYLLIFIFGVEKRLITSSCLSQTLLIKTNSYTYFLQMTLCLFRHWQNAKLNPDVNLHCKLKGKVKVTYTLDNHLLKTQLRQLWYNLRNPWLKNWERVKRLYLRKKL